MRRLLRWCVTRTRPSQQSVSLLPSVLLSAVSNEPFCTAVCVGESACVLTYMQDHPSAFNCSCAIGWEGAECELDINECLSQPCNGTANDAETPHGTCSHSYYNGQISHGDYSCSCSTGWTGTNCGVDIDECASYPCTNGQCVEGVDSYSCTCASGFRGDNCAVDVNECQQKRLGLK